MMAIWMVPSPAGRGAIAMFRYAACWWGDKSFAMGTRVLILGDADEERSSSAKELERRTQTV